VVQAGHERDDVEPLRAWLVVLEIAVRDGDVPNCYKPDLLFRTKRERFVAEPWETIGEAFGDLLTDVSRPFRSTESSRVAARRSFPDLRVFECLTDFLCDFVVLTTEECMAGADRQRYWPIDDFQRGQTGQRRVVRELVWARDTDSAEDRQGHGEGVGIANCLDGDAVSVAAARFFVHCLPFRHGQFSS
jgi:hypothetical protein